METVVTPATPEETPVRGYGQTLMDLFIAPGDAFADIVKRPRVLIAFGLLIALNLILAGVWLSHADVIEVTRARNEAIGQPAPPPQAAPFIRGFYWAAFAVFPIIANLLLAGVFLLTMNFIHGAKATYRAVLGVTLHTGIAVSGVVFPTMMLIWALKGDWNVPPDLVLQANLGVLVERTTSKALNSLLSNVDVFAIWSATLFAIGLGRAAGRPAGWAWWTVGPLWIVWILIKLGLSVMF
jgi:Yip1 domain